MKIIINGSTRDIDGNQNLDELLKSSYTKIEGVIVELNGEFIKKENRSKYTLREGDAIEVIQFLGGG